MKRVIINMIIQYKFVLNTVAISNVAMKCIVLLSQIHDNYRNIVIIYAYIAISFHYAIQISIRKSTVHTISLFFILSSNFTLFLLILFNVVF